MIVFLVLATIVILICVFAMLIAGVTLWICLATSPCEHYYKRIDSCNDKKMVLVCKRCGKIKRLRK